MKNILLLLSLCLAFSVLCNAQDKSFCDIDKIPADPANLPIPVIDNLKSQYRAVLEENDPKKLLTEEIVEIFDGLANIGISIVSSDGLRTLFYSYFDTNELLVIEGEKCLTFPLNQSVSLTPFTAINVDGKLHIGTPLNLMLNSNIKFVYIGSNQVVRGMPVNQWQTCLYSELNQTTIRLTLSYTDPQKWISAIGSNNDSVFSVPVETYSEMKTGDGVYSSQVTSVTSYRYGTFLEEEDYNTPVGVYCPGRINRKPVPKIPDSFSFRTQITEAVPKSLDLIGVITNIREAYDYKKKLFRIDYNLKGTPYHEVHDFNTGLRYKLDRYRGDCEIIPLSDGVDTGFDGINLKIRNPTELFKLDDVPVQYVGVRRVSGINTDVWIGPKQINGQDSIIEWHFATDGWLQQESLDINTNEIVLITISQKATIVNEQGNPEAVDLVRKFNIYDFDSKRIDDFDFDISYCAKKIGFRQIFFKLSKKDADSLKSQSVEFRKGIIDSVVKTSGVIQTRVSRVEILYEADDADGTFVTFMLYERPSFYGNVNRTQEDITLQNAITKLDDAVTSGSMDIIVNMNHNQTITIKPLSNSFQTGDSRFDLQVTRQLVYNQGYSGGAVAITTIVVTLVGITIGIFLIALHKIKKINLPFISRFESN